MKLTDELVAVWLSKTSMDSVLLQLVIETSLRASGCWRVQAGFLELVGFGCSSDMPKEVSDGFQDATRHVPLDQLGLGIVKAAVTNEPVIGRREVSNTGLEGSATWISRFAANSSLAVPIRSGPTNLVVGVLAVSTTASVEPGDSLWETMEFLAKELGECELKNE